MSQSKTSENRTITALEACLLGGYIAFKRGDSIQLEKVPEYGEITLKYRNGEHVQTDVKITKK